MHTVLIILSAEFVQQCRDIHDKTMLQKSGRNLYKAINQKEN